MHNTHGTHFSPERCAQDAHWAVGRSSSWTGEPCASSPPGSDHFAFLTTMIRVLFQKQSCMKHKNIPLAKIMIR